VLHFSQEQVGHAGDEAELNLGQRPPCHLGRLASTAEQAIND
jgi:hypothetical protein